MKKLLIVVDVQNDFVDGSLGSKEAEAIIPNVRKKIQKYQNGGGILFFTRDTHQKDYLMTQEGRMLPVEHCIIGTNGWQIYDNLDNGCVDARYIDKPSFGYKEWENALGSIIDEIEEIELCGLCTDICVVSNALLLKACYPEIKLTVDADCCAGVTAESHKAALSTMKMCQIHIQNMPQPAASNGEKA